jgi:hypothetical protein
MGCAPTAYESPGLAIFSVLFAVWAFAGVMYPRRANELGYRLRLFRPITRQQYEDGFEGAQTARFTHTLMFCLLLPLVEVMTYSCWTGVVASIVLAIAALVMAWVHCRVPHGDARGLVPPGRRPRPALPLRVTATERRCGPAPQRSQEPPPRRRPVRRATTLAGGGSGVGAKTALPARWARPRGGRCVA